MPALAVSPPTDVTMATAGKRSVRPGQTVTVKGRVNPAGRGWAVRLEFAPRGRRYIPVAGTRSAADGSYTLRYRVWRSGTLRTQAERGRPSPTRRVTVLSTLRAGSRRHVVGLSAVRIRGLLKPAERGRSVRVQLRSGRRWKTVGRARTSARGGFALDWHPRRPGRYRLRAVTPASRRSSASRSRPSTLYVYRPGRASYYGPGLYGNPVSCGGTLGAGTLGVAHRSLPCGTKVTFRHRGRSVTVRVIDRGPFAAGREWDLTAATKARLGFGSTGTVWSTR